MKNKLQIFLVVLLCFCLFGCGKKENYIELTVDNVESYIEISGGIKGTGTPNFATQKNKGEHYSDYEIIMYASGKSSAYEYKDVYIELEVDGTYVIWLSDAERSINDKITIKCDEAGNGYAEHSGNVPKSFSDNGGIYNVKAGYYNIVSVSGKLVEK